MEIKLKDFHNKPTMLSYLTDDLDTKNRINEQTEPAYLIIFLGINITVALFIFHHFHRKTTHFDRDMIFFFTSRCGAIT